MRMFRCQPNSRTTGQQGRRMRNTRSMATQRRQHVGRQRPQFQANRSVNTRLDTPLFPDSVPAKGCLNGTHPHTISQLPNSYEANIPPTNVWIQITGIHPCELITMPESTTAPFSPNLLTLDENSPHPKIRLNRLKSTLSAIALAEPVTFPISRAITDNTGRTMQGTIISKTDTGIKFRRTSDGLEFMVPLEKLTENDRAYIAEAKNAPVSKTDAFSATSSITLQVQVEKRQSPEGGKEYLESIATPVFVRGQDMNDSPALVSSSTTPFRNPTRSHSIGLQRYGRTENSSVRAITAIV